MLQLRNPKKSNTMTKKKDRTIPWGAYKLSLLLRMFLIIKYIGLSRGCLRHKILEFISYHHKQAFVDYKRYGLKFRLSIRNNNTDAKILTTSKSYEKEELDYLYKYCKGNHFIDIGANTGFYSLSLGAVSNSSKILSIEPNPNTSEILEFNILSNDLTSRIKVEKCGIGDKKESTFYSSGDLGSVSILKINDQQNESFKMSTMPLLEIINRNKITNIDAIKIDIEGMECSALVPFFKNSKTELFPKCIILEHNHDEFWEEDLISILSDVGYTIKHKNRSNYILALIN